MAHPLSGADIKTLRRVLKEAGPGVDAGRKAAIWGSVLGRAPFTALEKARTEAIVPSIEALEPPVFILGHWRSGTTHLYNIMSLGAFGYVPPTAVGMPWDTLYLGRMLQPFLHKALPESRYIDNIPVTPTSPQEDEIGVANMSAMSFYHGIYFPARFDYFVDRGLFFDHASEADIEDWKRAFTLFLRKLAHAQGQPMLIKNPVYTARPAMLREMFPDAKFIHIHRDPFDVFLSMRNFWAQLLNVMALQPYDYVDVDAQILRIYDRMMALFEAETAGWAAPDYVEIAYAELDADPMGAVRQIYDTLQLPGWAAAAPTFEAYLKSVKSYKKNAFKGDAEAVDKVRGAWGRWLDKWGYATPAPRTA
ncbi:MAG: sulfotransferase [Pseudomonadota bacterium]